MNLKKVILLSKKDRLGLSIFLVCGILIQVFLYLHSLRKFRNAENILIQNLSIKSLDTVPYQEEYVFHTRKTKQNEKHSFSKLKPETPSLKTPIDPNTADSMSFISLGFNAFTIRNLLAYRKTGAVFKNIHDLSRIYGMDSLLLYTKKDIFVFPTHKTSKSYFININQADSLELQKLKGIGPVLSARTIRYRNALGGFTNVNQILEVYGIEPDFLTKNESHISCTGEVRQLDLNKVNEDILKRHPYIDYKTASIIIRYREQHGEYKTVTALKSIHLMKDSIFEKIQPYCMVKRNN